MIAWRIETANRNKVLSFLGDDDDDFIYPTLIYEGEEITLTHLGVENLQSAIREYMTAVGYTSLDEIAYGSARALLRELVQGTMTDQAGNIDEINHPVAAKAKRFLEMFK